MSSSTRAIMLASRAIYYFIPLKATQCYIITYISFCSDAVRLRNAP